MQLPTQDDPQETQNMNDYPMQMPITLTDIQLPHHREHPNPSTNTSVNQCQQSSDARTKMFVSGYLRTQMPSLRDICPIIVSCLSDKNNLLYPEIHHIGHCNGFDATPIVACFAKNRLTTAPFALPAVAGYSDADEFIEDANPQCDAHNLKVVWHALRRKHVISGAMKLISRQGRTMVNIAEHLLQDIIGRPLLEEDTFHTAAQLRQHLQETIRLADRDGLVHTLEPSRGCCVVLINSGLHCCFTGEMLYMLCVPDDFAFSEYEWQFVRFVTFDDIELFAPCYGRGLNLPRANQKHLPGTYTFVPSASDNRGGDEEDNNEEVPINNL